MPKTRTLAPATVWSLGDTWASGSGAGTEVAVVTDSNDGTGMTVVNGFDALYYRFAPIPDAPGISRVIACTLTYRWSNNPLDNADFRSLATISGVGQTPIGSIVLPGLANHSITWTPYVTTVAAWNDASTIFGCDCNWTVTTGPILREFSASVTYELPAGGFATIIL